MGDCTCPHQIKLALPHSDGKRYVDSYSIDTQLGLNEFARVISPGFVLEDDGFKYYSNLMLVKLAEKGTDICGVLERAARNRSLRTKSNALFNWFGVQKDFAKMDIPLHFDRPESYLFAPLTEENLASYLKKVAYYHKKDLDERVSDFDKWMYALDSLASQVSPEK